LRDRDRRRGLRRRRRLRDRPAVQRRLHARDPRRRRALTHRRARRPRAAEPQPDPHPPSGRSPRLSTATIRYRRKPAPAQENADPVGAVYAELAQREPNGFRYATFRDGEAFTHVAFGEGPLQELAAFQRFREGLNERCAEPPHVVSDTVGAYGLEV